MLDIRKQPLQPNSPMQTGWFWTAFRLGTTTAVCRMLKVALAGAKPVVSLRNLKFGMDQAHTHQSGKCTLLLLPTASHVPFWTSKHIMKPLTIGSTTKKSFGRQTISEAEPGKVYVPSGVHDLTESLLGQVFAGACGYTYGCNSIWQMHNGDSDSHPPIKMPVCRFTMPKTTLG